MISQAQTALDLTFAAHIPSVSAAARRYQALGLSVLPLSGKRPSIKWKAWQQQPAPLGLIDYWIRTGLFQNIGIVCGRASRNLVIIDLDGPYAYRVFRDEFGRITNTFTVRSGGGGHHLYLQVDQLPESTQALHTPHGNIELRSSGQQVVVPPSIHPQTQKPYTIIKALPVKGLPHIDSIVDWIQTVADHIPARPASPSTTASRPATRSNPSTTINPAVTAAIAARLRAGPYRVRGDWINCSCIYPERHNQHDRHFSFGFNLQSSYGFCYVCGTLLTKEIAAALNINPTALGGLFQAPKRPIP